MSTFKKPTLKNISNSRQSSFTFWSRNSLKIAVFWDVTLYSLVEFYSRRKTTNSYQISRRHVLHECDRHRHDCDNVKYRKEFRDLFESKTYFTVLSKSTVRQFSISKIFTSPRFCLRFNTVTLSSKSDAPKFSIQNPLTWSYKTKFKKYGRPHRNSLDGVNACVQQVVV